VPARSRSHKFTLLANQPTRPGDVVDGAGNRPRRISRQRVVALNPAILNTSGRDMNRSTGSSAVIRNVV